jgi:hypothetical protein
LLGVGALGMHLALQAWREVTPVWAVLLIERIALEVGVALELDLDEVRARLIHLHARRGELKRGEAWLMKFDEINEQTHEMSSVTARTQFISSLTQSGHVAEALPYLDWLRDVYAHVRTTDSHFLYMRGIPFFPSFLENSLPILKANMRAEAVARRYGVLSEQLDEEGEAQLGQWLQSLMVAAER